MPAREGPEFPHCLVVGLGDLCRKTNRSLLIFSHVAREKGVTLSSLTLTKNEYCGWGSSSIGRGLPSTASTAHGTDLPSQNSEIEGGASKVQSPPWLQSKFEVNLGYVRACL